MQGEVTPEMSQQCRNLARKKFFHIGPIDLGVHDQLTAAVDEAARSLRKADPLCDDVLAAPTKAKFDAAGSGK